MLIRVGGKRGRLRRTKARGGKGHNVKKAHHRLLFRCLGGQTPAAKKETSWEWRGISGCFFGRRVEDIVNRKKSHHTVKTRGKQCRRTCLGNRISPKNRLSSDDKEGLTALPPLEVAKAQIMQVWQRISGRRGKPHGGIPRCRERNTRCPLFEGEKWEGNKEIEHRQEVVTGDKGICVSCIKRDGEKKKVKALAQTP